MRISVVVVLFIMLVASALGQTSKIVYIGAALPLTGGLQSYGIGVKNAVELAVEDANKMCPNFQFHLLIEDTGTDPQQALEKIQTLYAKGARLIVGPMASGEVNAVRSFADQNKILIFSPSSGLEIVDDWVYRMVPTTFAEAEVASNQLKHLGIKSIFSPSSGLEIVDDWVYRMVPIDFAQAVAIADLLKYLGIKRVVIIYRTDAWGFGLGFAIANESKKLGIRIVAAEGYDPDPKAFPTAVPEVIRKLSAALGRPGPDVAIIFVTFEDDGILAVQAAAQDPVLSKVRWIGTDGVAYSKAMIEQVGKEMAAGKMLGTIAAPDPNDPKYQQFKERYRAKYGKDPVAYDPYGYDAAMMLMQIVCSIGTDDPAKVKETLEQWGKEGKYQGVTGRKVYLDEAGDRAYPNYIIWGVTLEGGTPKYIDAAYYYGTERRFSIWRKELIEGEFTWLIKILHDLQDPDFWLRLLRAVWGGMAIIWTLTTLARAITKRGKGPPEGSGKSSRSVCQVFCRAWDKAAQLASYAEGSLVKNEKMREDFVTLLSQFLGELENVKFKLSREEANELDYIRREVESIVETIKHVGITTLTYREILYIHSRLKIIGEKLDCSCK